MEDNKEEQEVHQRRLLAERTRGLRWVEGEEGSELVKEEGEPKVRDEEGEAGAPKVGEVGVPKGVEGVPKVVVVEEGVVGLPKVRVEVPKVEVGVPKVEVGVPKVEVGVPKVEVGVPKVGVGVPKVGVGEPNVDAGVEEGVGLLVEPKVKTGVGREEEEGVGEGMEEVEDVLKVEELKLLDGKPPHELEIGELPKVEGVDRAGLPKIEAVVAPKAEG